ncbi:chlorohydrolase [Salinigranum rubrum]|uniref:Chlorohydrolase n=1 Tax=Salinigranum rubrum TaxID=755307 RepID=A0A2I8VFY1_9EURY|nr:amidohydrolase [Salinigranum rubrum]AUV80825.1 chlorohydrolase [Salinigranum rubrum]
MVDILVENATVLTMNDDRDVIDAGAVAIDEGEIVDVGSTSDLADRHDAARVLDASGCAVLPGFISSHVHVSDILLRGLEKDRSLLDWLYNVKKPGVHAMTPDENAVAAALYCLEAIQSGITTFVENGTGAGNGYSLAAIEAKLHVYDCAGIRNVYCHGFSDRESSPAVEAFIERLVDKEPTVDHYFPETEDTDAALDETESYIERYHGSADGRQSVWPCPGVAWGVTPAGLRGAYELAERHDVMTTTHASETVHEEMGHLSTIEYLNSADYLGERTLLGHCVHVDDRDIRLLSTTDTRVAHNPVTNLALGSGIAPVPDLLGAGVTVGLGTDNTSGSDTVNMLNDLRFAALIHKGARRDPGAITAKKVLEMATIDAARAIGREADLGSLEPGKRADLLVLDLDYPHLVPHADVAAAVVYQAQGFEVETVICDGAVVMESRNVHGVQELYPTLHETAVASATDVLDRAGLSGIETNWESVSST